MLSERSAQTVTFPPYSVYGSTLTHLMGAPLGRCVPGDMLGQAQARSSKQGAPYMASQAADSDED